MLANRPVVESTVPAVRISDLVALTRATLEALSPTARYSGALVASALGDFRFVTPLSGAPRTCARP